MAAQKPAPDTYNDQGHGRGVVTETAQYAGSSPPRQAPPAAVPPGAAAGFEGVATPQAQAAQVFDAPQAQAAQVFDAPQAQAAQVFAAPTVQHPGAPQAGTVALPEGPTAYQVGRPDFERVDIDYGQFDATTRGVGANELVATQMQGLLDSESPYMQQALLAGQRQAASRGALSSSLAAGASQAAAIQAAFPIAAADAQTYSRVASENAAAINNVNLAKLQSTTQMASTIMQASAAMAQAQLAAQTQLDTAEMSSRTSLLTSQMGAQTQLDATAMQAESAANIAQMQAQTQSELGAMSATSAQGIAQMQAQMQGDLGAMSATSAQGIAQMQANMQGSLGAMSANSAQGIAQMQTQMQAEIAQMNIQAQQQSQHFMSHHDQMMEMQRQGGRVELANLDFGFRTALQDRGFQHDFDMNALTNEQQKEILALSNEYALEQMDYQGGINSFLQNQQIQAGIEQTILGQALNAMGMIGASEMDAVGQQAALTNFFSGMNAIMNLPFFSFVGPGSP